MVFFFTFDGNRDDAKAYDIIYLLGKASTRFQCNNITDFTINQNNENNINDRSILDIRGPKCLYMVMNTLYNLEADCIFYLNSQNKTARHDHYILDLQILLITDIEIWALFELACMPIHTSCLAMPSRN